MFNVGDLVTGVNRGYRRSIYKVESIDGDEILISPVWFEGRSFKYQTFEHIKRRADQMRVARKEEIDIEYKECLFLFINRLLGSRRSFLVQRWPDL